MKKSIKIITACAATAGAAFFGVGEVLYRLFLTSKAVHDSKLLSEDKEFEELFNTNPTTVEGTKWFAETPHENAKLVSSRGETLHAYLYTTDKPSHIWTILCHGYCVPPESNSAQAMRFLAENWNVLMPSLGGHGDSESKYVSMGWHDRLDVCDWINYICKTDLEAQIILYGVSMGGATVMMATGEKLPDNVKCAVEDCGYTSVNDEFCTQIKAALHMPSFPFINAVDIVTRLHAGYGFKEASSVEQLKKSVTPTLFIHGAEDDFVPVEMVNLCHDACACEDKEKRIFEGARHGCSGIVDPVGYFDAIKSFVCKHLDIETA